MKRSIQYTASIILVGLIGISACTSSFEDFNTKQSGFDDEKKKEYDNLYGTPLSIVQQGIYFNYDWGGTGGRFWPFQMMQNLNADMYSGYFHNCKGYNNGASNSTYRMQDDFNASNWENTYGYIMPEIRKSEVVNGSGNSGFFGITKILKVALMHRLTDIYGPIIYKNFGDSKVGSSPDTQKEAYEQFFLDLTQAEDSIKKQMRQHYVESFERFDALMPKGKKTYEQWLKFGNSLRLRLALRIVNVDPEKAKIEGEKALRDKNQLLTQFNDVVAVSAASGYINPLGIINKEWRELYMNANIESIMTGYDDPRLPKYFDKAPGNVDLDNNIYYKYNGTYKGIRQGIGFTHDKYRFHSPGTVTGTTDAILMTAAEVWFLRAEAALRGWGSTVESPEKCYEEGIASSFYQWGVIDVSVKEYLGKAAMPRLYIDAFDKKHGVDYPVETTLPIWEEQADFEVKLAKISIQKWLACYPEGCEAWANQRRTGYPRLFKVFVNRSTSENPVDTEKGVRRLNFPVSIKTSNPKQYEELVEALGNGAKDYSSTNLWWDTSK